MNLFLSKGEFPAVYFWIKNEHGKLCGAILGKVEGKPKVYIPWEVPNTIEQNFKTLVAAKAFVKLL